MVLLLATFHELVASMSDGFATRVSIVMAGMNVLSDGGMFVGHVFAAAMQAQAAMVALLSSALLFLVLFSFLGIRLLLLIEKARHPELFAGGAVAFASRMWAMQRKFAFGMLIVIILSVAGEKGWGLHVLCFLACSFWLPQIIHSARHDCRPGVTPLFLWGSSIARIALPVYALGCPNNLIYFLMPAESQDAAHAWAKDAAAAPFSNPFSVAHIADETSRFPWPCPGSSTLPAQVTPERASMFAREAAFAIFLVCWMTVQAVVIHFQVSFHDSDFEADSQTPSFSYFVLIVQDRLGATVLCPRCVFAAAL